MLCGAAPPALRPSSHLPPFSSLPSLSFTMSLPRVPDLLRGSPKSQPQQEPISSCKETSTVGLLWGPSSQSTCDPLPPSVVCHHHTIPLFLSPAANWPLRTGSLSFSPKCTTVPPAHPGRRLTLLGSRWGAEQKGDGLEGHCTSPGRTRWRPGKGGLVEGDRRQRDNTL